ncbi:MAG: cation diffusion facilitator family transporter [Candidatus Kaiserbacteria bacterium]|nr:MAG: cation diffusion facilitator family transporter [Candidatus Kaiserbacteria bacterium]
MALQHTQGFWPVAAAIGGNTSVTVIKFVAALSSGSSSMLSEAVHSLADTVNQILLLIGLGRSTKRSDDQFEYGYGNERFFWALISACGVLFVGAGVTVYQGISALSADHSVEFSSMVFLVLAISLVIESYTFSIAARSLRRAFPEASWRERLALADPSTLSVYLEDAVAVIGVLIAAGSLTLTFLTGDGLWDALGSIVIGTMLAVVAITLIMRNRSYLIGAALPEEVREEIIALLQSDPAIERVLDFKSSTVGFGKYRIKCEVEFNGAAFLRTSHRGRGIKRQFEEIQNDFEAFKKFSADYADRIPRLIGKKIDDLEARIRAAFPQIRHIDIEVN